MIFFRRLCGRNINVKAPLAVQPIEYVVETCFKVAVGCKGATKGSRRVTLISFHLGYLKCLGEHYIRG